LRRSPASVVKLADEIDWAGLDAQFAPLFCADNGAPAHPVRQLVGFTYLQATYGLSDDAAIAQWRENVYWVIRYG
jgi:IS5 family transposase